MNEQELIKQALATWGQEDQLNMLQEECAELIAAINRWRRGRTSVAAMIEEGVDVSLMLEQLKLITGNPETWAHLRDEKLIRLATLISIAKSQSERPA